jgi:hypothetical protein
VRRPLDPFPSEKFVYGCAKIANGEFRAILCLPTGIAPAGQPSIYIDSTLRLSRPSVSVAIPSVTIQFRESANQAFKILP